MADSENQHCPFLEGCPIFKYFRKYAVKVYIAAYCQGEYSTCKRYQLRMANQPVPEDLLPTGVRLLPEKRGAI